MEYMKKEIARLTKLVDKTIDVVKEIKKGVSEGCECCKYEERNRDKDMPCLECVYTDEENTENYYDYVNGKNYNNQTVKITNEDEE